MKLNNSFSILLLNLFIALSLVACSSKPTTKVDINPKINFSLLSSFQFSSKQNITLDANPIMINRIQSAVAEHLIKNGFKQVDFINNQSADLTIDVDFSLHEKPNNSSISIGLGTGRIGSHSSGSIGISTSIPINNAANYITKITINMKHGEEPAWHGVDNYEASEDISIEETNKAVIATVNRLLADFPPSSVSSK